MVDILHQESLNLLPPKNAFVNIAVKSGPIVVKKNAEHNLNLFDFKINHRILFFKGRFLKHKIILISNLHICGLKEQRFSPGSCIVKADGKKQPRGMPMIPVDVAGVVGFTNGERGRKTADFLPVGP